MYRFFFLRIKKTDNDPEIILTDFFHREVVKNFWITVKNNIVQYNFNTCVKVQSEYMKMYIQKKK